MSNNPTAITRYEMKYRISAEMVAPITRAILPYCEPDRASKNGSYIISSLYLDTPSFKLYRETADHAPKRFKLRVRRYMTGDLFLEVKGRDGDVVVKTRGRLPTEYWPRLLYEPKCISDIKLSTENRSSIDVFCLRCLENHARPAAVIRYRRQAFVSIVDFYGRVTFDEQIEVSQPVGWTVPAENGPHWIPIDNKYQTGGNRSGVILELKCLQSVPRWISDLVSRFNLHRSGFSKYGNGVDAIYGDKSKLACVSDELIHKDSRR